MIVFLKRKSRHIWDLARAGILGQFENAWALEIDVALAWEGMAIHGGSARKEVARAGRR
jgi:hypothetical protein